MSEALAGRRLLVTGASGFIGSRLCERAATLGAEVHRVSRRPPADAPRAERWAAADLADEDAARRLVQRVRPDAVLHLASEVTGDRGAAHVVPMLRANLLAAVNTMLAAHAAGCPRVVLAGSMEEPDLGDPGATPQSPYAAAKLGALAYARMFGALYGLGVTHLRIFMVYGPGQRDLHKLVPYVTTSLLHGEAPALMSGDREIDWIYVDDVVDAFLAAAVASDADGRSLDIGSGALVPVRTIAERLAELVGSGVAPVFGARPDRQLERVRIADPAAAAAALGWEPRVPLDDGLARTVAAYRATLGARSAA